MLYKCLVKYMDRKGKYVAWYRLLSETGAQGLVDPITLKAAMKAGAVEVVNLKLTADGKLISGTTGEYGAVEMPKVDVIDPNCPELWRRKVECAMLMEKALFGHGGSN